MLRLLALFTGPIFAKEMVEMARRKRYYFNRLLYGLVLLFTLFLIYEQYSWRLRYGGGDLIRTQAAMAADLFHAVSCVQFAAVFLFVPLFLCGVVASEREEQTLDLLFTTHLTDREIVLGKLGSRVAALIFLILTGLPVLSLIMLFGGIDPVALAQIMAATLAAILFASAHAIYFSTITKSPIGALVRTYWWLAVWLLFVPMMVSLFLKTLMLGGVLRFMAVPIAGSLICVNPIGPLFIVLQPDSYQFLQGELAKLVGDTWALGFFPATLLLPALWSVFLIWRAVVRLRGGPVPFFVWLRTFRPVRALLDFLVHPIHSFRAVIHRETEGWGDDPVLGAVARWFRREVRNPLWQRSRWTRVYDREHYIGRIQWAGWLLVLFFLFLVALVHARTLARDEGSIVFFVPTWIGVVALTAILAGSSLVGDRRRGFLDQVLVTPLTAPEVIRGTLLAVWEHMRRTFWLVWFLGLFFCVTGASNPLAILASLITGTLTCAVVAQCGVLCSMSARTMPGALVPTFVFLLVITAGTPWVILFEKANGPVLWVLCGLLFLGARAWVRRSLSSAAVGCYYLAIHLGIACLLTGWTAISFGHPDGCPAAVLNPAVWTIMLLERHWFEADHQWFAWFLALMCYWLSLAITLIWGRRWLIRDFDRLVGRIDAPNVQAVRPVVPLKEIKAPPADMVLGTHLEKVTPRCS